MYMTKAKYFGERCIQSGLYSESYQLIIELKNTLVKLFQINLEIIVLFGLTLIFLIKLSG